MTSDLIKSDLIKLYPSNCNEEFVKEYYTPLDYSGNSLYRCPELPNNEVMLQ